MFFFGKTSCLIIIIKTILTFSQVKNTTIKLANTNRISMLVYSKKLEKNYYKFHYNY